MIPLVAMPIVRTRCDAMRSGSARHRVAKMFICALQMPITTHTYTTVQRAASTDGVLDDVAKGKGKRERRATAQLPSAARPPQSRLPPVPCG